MIRNVKPICVLSKLAVEQAVKLRLAIFPESGAREHDGLASRT